MLLLSPSNDFDQYLGHTISFFYFYQDTTNKGVLFEIFDPYNIVLPRNGPLLRQPWCSLQPGFPCCFKGRSFQRTAGFKAANFANRAYDNYSLGFPRDGVWKVRMNSDWNGYSLDFDSDKNLDQ
jgi:hypothetical protein